MPDIPEAVQETGQAYQGNICLCLRVHTVLHACRRYHLDIVGRQRLRIKEAWDSDAVQGAGQAYLGQRLCLHWGCMSSK